MPPKKLPMKRKAAQNSTNTTDGSLSRDDAFKQAFYSDTSSSDDDDTRGQLSRRKHLRHKRLRRPKRPKTSTPSASDLSDVEEDFDSNDAAERGLSIDHKGLLQILNAPNGPQLKIDLTEILAKNGIPINNLLHAAGLDLAVTNSHGRPLTKPVKLASFTDLPFELTANIYRDLFVTQNPILFTDRRGFARAGQFLRTCRKVHEEGTTILYGENSFHFSRAHFRRGTYYESYWKEIGYKDVRRFLANIGPQNMGKLKYVSLDFEDALPTFTPFLTTEERNYAHDPNLIEILKMFGRHTTFEKFAIGLRGRRSLETRDYNFLKALCSIRCHQIWRDPGGNLKMSWEVWQQVRRLCVLPRKADNNIDQGKKKFVPTMRNTTQSNSG